MASEIWIYNQFNDRRHVVPVQEDVVTIGRDPGNTVCLQSPFISRQHARLIREGDRWFVENVGLNGTTVANQVVADGERMPVREGDEIRLGEFSLYVVDREKRSARVREARQDPSRRVLEIEKAIHSQLLERLNLRRFSADAKSNEAYVQQIKLHLEDLIDKAMPKVDRATARHLVENYLRRRVLNAVARLATGKLSYEYGFDDSDVLVDKYEQVLSELVQNMIDDFELALRPETIKEDLWAVEQRFDQIARNYLAQFTPGLTQYVVRRMIAKDITDIVLGYGPLQDLLEMPNVSEIMVVGADKIYVEKNGVITSAGRRFFSDEIVYSIIERIITPTGRKIDQSTPLVDSRLPDGSRVNAIIPPLSLCGPCLTIRKFSKVPFTIDDLIEFGTLNERAAAFLRAAVAGKLNMVISGASGSGKTTLLNVLSGFCAREERIVTVEDSAELQLPQEHVVSLETRPANIEGRGEYSIRELVRNALRMRPDRIIVGECRGPEALDMLQAMNTGHDGSLTTVHANSPQDAMARIETMVLMAVDMPVRAIREQIVGALDVVVHISRLSDGRRRVTAISEVVGVDRDTGQIIMEDIFVLRSRSGQKRTLAADAELMHTGYIPEFAAQLIHDGHLSIESFL